MIMCIERFSKETYINKRLLKQCEKDDGVHLERCTFNALNSNFICYRMFSNEKQMCFCFNHVHSKQVQPTRSMKPALESTLFSPTQPPGAAPGSLLRVAPQSSFGEMGDGSG